MSEKNLNYKDSGVDIEAANEGLNEVEKLLINHTESLWKPISGNLQLF